MPSLSSPSRQEDILTGLNAAQREAVLHGEGPQLVVAGAGTGKTAVITRRIAQLVADKKCSPREILALTFTDKAAEEMESRVDQLVPYGFTDSTICTFHAFGDRVLREKGILLGLNPAYTILSSTEQLVFMRQHLFTFPLQALRPLSDPTRHLQLLAGVISRAQDEDVSAEDYLQASQRRLESQAADPALRAAWQKHEEIARVYAAYQERLQQKGLLDFGGLLQLTLKLFRRHPDVLAEYRERYRYILVDEFQDTNAAQFELVRLLAGPDGNLTVVGDDDQSIYKFRGAAISNILQFTRHYPRARLTVLTENYRSTQPILDAAYRLIQHNNPERLEAKLGLSKKLNSRREGGTPVRYEPLATVSDEADWVAKEIKRRRETEKRPWSDFTILVRTNRQADPFIRACNVMEIPARFTGAHGFYQRPEIRLCLSFLRTLADPLAPLPLYDLGASEIYDLPAVDLARLSAHSRRHHLSLWETMRQAERSGLPDLSPQGKTDVARLLQDLDTYLEMSRRSSAGQILYHFLTAGGLLARYAEINNLAADLTIRNWAKLFKQIQRFQEISGQERVLPLVEYLDLANEVAEDVGSAEAEAENDAVQVLTVHRAKGLEFPVVFIVGLAANRFPMANRQPAIVFPAELAKEELPAGDQSLAEERRLCYVAVTRAAEALYLTSAKDYGGSRQYKVSRFVLEALDLPAPVEPSRQASALEQIRRAQEGMPVQPLEAMNNPQNEALSLSFYQIDDYLTCPLKYKYTHLLEVPVLPQHAVIYGKALHTAITAYHRAQLSGLKLTEREMIDAFLAAWVNAGFISREHEEMRQQAGINAIKLFIKKNDITQLKPTYIEKSFTYEINQIKVVGRMDRVDAATPDSAVIIDYKSSEVNEQAEADKKAHDSLQLKIYAQAWYHETGHWPQAVKLYFLDTGLMGSWQVEPAKVEKETLVIEKVAEKIRRGFFSATPSVWTCNYCPYRIICPEAQK